MYIQKDEKDIFCLMFHASELYPVWKHDVGCLHSADRMSFLFYTLKWSMAVELQELMIPDLKSLCTNWDKIAMSELR